MTVTQVETPDNVAMRFDINRVMVGDRKRELGDISSLAQSIKEIGLINPISIQPNGNLVAGYHRLEACKSLGWQTIPTTILNLEALDAELAEIDENLVRNELHWFDRDKQLARRKEIYEIKHPQTKQGGDRKSEDAKSKRDNRDLIPSFVQDTAQKTSYAPRTVQESIQRATTFTEEQGEILKSAEITQTEATKLARLDQPQRLEVIESIAKRNIDNIPIAVPHISSKNNEWYTPQKYIDAAHKLMGGIDLDPASCTFANETVKAARYYDISTNGLDKDWPKRVWLNPPYGYTDGKSNQDVWSSRLIDQFKNKITTEAMLLVNAAVDTAWFHRLLQDYAVCLTLGRINFTTPEPVANGSTHGSAFVYFGPKEKQDKFVEIFGEFGTVVKRW